MRVGENSVRAPDMVVDHLGFLFEQRGPREPGNIGASARALKNMGFMRLALVDPPAMADETKWFAHNALDVLEAARVHYSLEDALREKSIVAGTTRRKGKSRGVIYPVDQGTLKLRELAKDNEVAILFGREDRGLFNEEVEEFQRSLQQVLNLDSCIAGIVVKGLRSCVYQHELVLKRELPDVIPFKRYDRSHGLPGPAGTVAWIAQIGYFPGI